MCGGGGGNETFLGHILHHYVYSIGTAPCGLYILSKYIQINPYSM